MEDAKPLPPPKPLCPRCRRERPGVLGRGSPFASVPDLADRASGNITSTNRKLVTGRKPVARYAIEANLSMNALAR
jgi:hypothetical protein